MDQWNARLGDGRALCRLIDSNTGVYIYVYAQKWNGAWYEYINEYEYMYVCVQLYLRQSSNVENSP